MTCRVALLVAGQEEDVAGLDEPGLVEERDEGAGDSGREGAARTAAGP
ncbi:MAG: hypothetical protein M3Y33_02180 [Actinomycetota bacterium]|nr:hypothetical protein [Actinomycetota bacterium]